MKTNVNILLTAAAFCLTAWSCSGEDSTPLPPAPETPEQPIDPDALCTITLGSVAIAPVDMSQTPLTRSATGEPEQKATYSENLGHNSSIEATLEAMPQGAQTRAMVPLANKAWYHVVAIDNTGAIAGQTMYQVGSDTPVSGYAPLKLKVGTYRLFCYSKNKSYISTWEKEGKTIIVYPGEDFMTYTVPNFTISVDDCLNGKTLDIKFVRQCAKLIVTIKSDGYSPGNITDGEAVLTSDVFNDATWSIFNSDNSILTPPIGTVAIKIAQSSDGSSIDCGRNNLPYTLIAPFSNKTLKLGRGLAYVDGVKNEFYNDISFPNLTLAKGGSYRLTITIGNYYVLTNTNPVKMGDINWAKTNLQQADNSTALSFAMNPWDATKMWNWGMRDATDMRISEYASLWPTNSGEFQDPCWVNDNSWRLPTKVDAESLISKKLSSGSRVKINDNIRTVNTYGWTEDGAVFYDSTNGNLLFLPKKTNGTSASFWTNANNGGGVQSDAGTVYTAWCLNITNNQNAVITVNRRDRQPLRCTKWK